MVHPPTTTPASPTRTYTPHRDPRASDGRRVDIVTDDDGLSEAEAEPRCARTGMYPCSIAPTAEEACVVAWEAGWPVVESVVVSSRHGTAVDNGLG